MKLSTIFHVRSYSKKNIIINKKNENIILIQDFIAKVSKFQQDIIEKLSILKILKHQTKELENETNFFVFVKNFPHIYEICMEEFNRRRKLDLQQFKFLNYICSLSKSDELNKKIFYEENLNENEFYAKKLIAILFDESDSISKLFFSIKESIENNLPENYEIESEDDILKEKIDEM